MSKIVERIGDEYRMWSTNSDSYMTPPMTRGDLLAEMMAWGWTRENCTQRIDAAETVTEWSKGYGEDES